MLNYDVEVWFGLLGPKGLPPAIVDRIAGETKLMLEDPALRQQFDKLGFTPAVSSPAEFDALIRKEAQRWPALIRELGISGG